MKTSQKLKIHHKRLFSGMEHWSHGNERPIATNDEHCDQDEECNALTNKSDMKCQVVHLVETHVGAQN